MALYKYGNYLNHSGDAAFDEEYSPGTITPHSGIYRCVNCNDEIAANKGNPLPPQNHHQHRNNDPIRWQLLVFSQQFD